jgi:hypothetical protein
VAQTRSGGSPGDVALAMTVHQPDGGLQALAEAVLPALLRRYAAACALCSTQTFAPLVRLLRQQGVRVELSEPAVAGVEGLGHTKRASLRLGLLTGVDHVHVCDFDRALHWAAHYPDELDEVLALGQGADYLVLGRTGRAWNSHPAYQRHTEELFNRVYALITGQPWDIGAGSRMVSRQAASLLLERSEEPSVGIDAEWPLLVGAEPGLRLEYRECEGLEFETADRHRTEIEAAGGYEAWLRALESDPGRWAFRLRLATLIAEAAVRTTDDGKE